MITTQTHAKFVEWLSAEEMHRASKSWLSELLFIKDEHLFFEDLIKSHTFQLLDKEKFSDNKEVIDAINRSQRRNNELIKSVQKHENKLEIMVDGIDQLKEEEAYKKEHRDLIIGVNDFLKNYKILKTQLFDIIKNIKKLEKQRRLLDKS